MTLQLPAEYRHLENLKNKHKGWLQDNHKEILQDRLQQDKLLLESQLEVKKFRKRLRRSPSLRRITRLQTWKLLSNSHKNLLLERMTRSSSWNQLPSKLSISRDSQEELGEMRQRSNLPLKKVHEHPNLHQRRLKLLKNQLDLLVEESSKKMKLLNKKKPLIWVSSVTKSTQWAMTIRLLILNHQSQRSKNLNPNKPRSRQRIRNLKRLINKWVFPSHVEREPHLIEDQPEPIPRIKRTINPRVSTKKRRAPDNLKFLFPRLRKLKRRSHLLQQRPLQERLDLDLQCQWILIRLLTRSSTKRPLNPKISPKKCLSHHQLPSKLSNWNLQNLSRSHPIKRLQGSNLRSQVKCPSSKLQRRKRHLAL